MYYISIMKVFIGLVDHSRGIIQGKKQVDAVVYGGTIFAEHSTIIDFSDGNPEMLRQGKGNSSWLDQVL